MLYLHNSLCIFQIYGRIKFLLSCLVPSKPTIFKITMSPVCQYALLSNTLCWQRGRDTVWQRNTSDPSPQASRQQKGPVQPAYILELPSYLVHQEPGKKKTRLCVFGERIFGSCRQVALGMCWEKEILLLEPLLYSTSPRVNLPPATYIAAYGMLYEVYAVCSARLLCFFILHTVSHDTQSPHRPAFVPHKRWLVCKKWTWVIYESGISLILCLI